MNYNGQNEGIRMLDDFVCDAAGRNDLLNPNDRRPGKNGGMRSVDETVCDATPAEGVAAEIEFSELDNAMRSVDLDETVQFIVKRLAVCVNAHNDPFRVLASVQQRLIAEIESGSEIRSED